MFIVIGVHFGFKYSMLFEVAQLTVKLDMGDKKRSKHDKQALIFSARVTPDFGSAFGFQKCRFRLLFRLEFLSII